MNFLSHYYLHNDKNDNYFTIELYSSPIYRAGLSTKGRILVWRVLWKLLFIVGCPLLHGYRFLRLKSHMQYTGTVGTAFLVPFAVSHAPLAVQ